MIQKDIVLISGVTGFVGSEVTRQFIDDGYSVRGTTRSMDKAREWEEVNSEYKGKVEWVVVQDIVAPGAFQEAIVGVKYVVHTACPFRYYAEDNESEFLIPAIQGTKNILEAAKSQSSVKHFVMTSSFTALFDWDKQLRPGYTYTSKDWNPATYEDARTRDPVYAYCASKALAEKLVWECKERQFIVTTIVPSLIWGPLHQPVKRMEDLNQSAVCFLPLISGRSSDPIPKSGIPFPVQVDVRDVAALHVNSLTSPAAHNSRILAVGWHAFNVDVVDALRKTFADNQDALERIPTKPGLDQRLDHYGSDSNFGEKILGRKFITLERCAKDMAESLWELEKRWKYH